MTVTRSLVAAVAFAVVSAAVPALAGPPLICHPFDTRGGTLLPWDAGVAGTNWNAPLASYDTASLTADVVRLLDTDAPVLTRMENLRRATIYAQKDPVLARQLLDAVTSRTAGTAGPVRRRLSDRDLQTSRVGAPQKGPAGVGRHRRDDQARRVWPGDEGHRVARDAECRNGIRGLADDTGSRVRWTSRAGVGGCAEEFRARQ